MMANLDCFARMWGDESQAGCTSFAISLEEAVIVLSRWRQKARVYGVASRWRNSAKWSCAWAHGIPSRAPRDRPALMKSISMPTLSWEEIRRRGSEATAAISGAPEPGEWWQSIVGYVARGVRGDPRGRKSGAGSAVTNRRSPARAEGEKRLRSATRNP